MPDKVLNKILRFAIVECNPICVAADHPEDCSESSRGVLSVCHAIRAVARPMFYKENVFEVQVFSFDIMAVLPWLEMSSKFISESKKDGVETSSNPKSGDIDVSAKSAVVEIDVDEIPVSLAPSGKKSFDKPSIQVLKLLGISYDHFTKPSGFNLERSALDHFKPLSVRQFEMLDYFMNKLDGIFEEERGYSGGFFIVPKFEPHWDHLVEWLHSFHHGQVPRYSFDESSPEFCRAVHGLFDLVELEKEEGRTWSLFECRLAILRAVLAKGDARWLD